MTYTTQAQTANAATNIWLVDYVEALCKIQGIPTA